MNIRRVVRLYRAEMAKVWRTKFPYLGLLSSALMALIAMQSVESLSKPGGITAAGYFAASINLTTTTIVSLFATIFSAMIVSNEISRRTVRTILTRPITRGEFLTSKLLIALTYLSLLMLMNIIPAVIIAQKYPLVARGDEIVQIPGAASQISLFAIAILLTMLPLAATVCYGFCISTLSDNPATAIGVAVGVMLNLNFVSALIDISPWVVFRYYDISIAIASEKADGITAAWGQSKIYGLVIISLVTAVVTLSVAYWSFLRRDLNA